MTKGSVAVSEVVSSLLYISEYKAWVVKIYILPVIGGPSPMILCWVNLWVYVFVNFIWGVCV